MICFTRRKSDEPWQRIERCSVVALFIYLGHTQKLRKGKRTAENSRGLDDGRHRDRGDRAQPYGD